MNRKTRHRQGNQSFRLFTSKGFIGLFLKILIAFLLTAVLIVIYVGTNRADTDDGERTSRNGNDITRNAISPTPTRPFAKVPLEISPLPTKKTVANREKPSPGNPEVKLSPPVRLNLDDYSREPAEKSFISEVVFGHKSLNLLLEQNWDGNPDNMSLRLSQYPEELLDKIFQRERERANAFTIPMELRDLYTSPKGQEDILSLIFTARSEYTEFLRAKGVDARLIDYVEKILPADDDHISTDDIPDASGPISEVKDHRGANGMPVNDGTKDMHISATNIHNDARILLESGILGEERSHEVYKNARDMGVRRQVYHEMTHVLQAAYEKFYEDKGDYRKRLYNLEKDYFYHWGQDEIDSTWRNADIGRERQSDGVSFQAFVWRYDLNGNQANAVWDHLFGRLSEARDMLFEMMDIFESGYPEYDASDFGGDLFNALNIYQSGLKSEDANTMKGVVLRLLALPAYLGYFNTMTPEESVDFWSTLRRL